MSDTLPPSSPNTSRPLFNRIFISPDEPRLRSGWRLLIQFILMSVLIIPLSIPAVLLMSGIIPSKLPGLDLAAAQIGGLIAITFSVYLARRFLDHRSFASLGLKLNRWALWDVLVGCLIPIFMMGLIYLTEYQLGWLSFWGFSWEKTPASQVALTMLIMLAVFVFTGWQEELFSRGYLLQNLSEGLNPIWGAILSSLIFALQHSANPNISWTAFVGLTAAGLFFVFAYRITGQLWLAIGLHIGWNFFEGPVFGFPVSGLYASPLVLQTSEGPALITGSSFGPEAGLILLPALALGAVLIYLYSRLRANRLETNQNSPLIPNS